MLRVIATRTDDTWGLTEEAEFISTNTQLKEIFLEFGWVKPYDDTKPLPPKGLNNYEPGMSYPKGRYVVIGNALLQSNCETSARLVRSEWDTMLQGVI